MPDWMLDLVRAMGVAGGPVFAILFWLERAERQAAQKESRELLVQVLTTTAQATNSILEVIKAVAAVGEGMKGVNGLLSQLAPLVQHLLSSGSFGKRGG